MRDFDGGIAEWERAGLPLERGEARRATAPRRPGTAKLPIAEAAARWVGGRSIGTLLATWFWINLGCGFLYWAISFFRLSYGYQVASASRSR